MKTVLTTLLLLMPLAILKAQTNIPDTIGTYVAVDTPPSFPGGKPAFNKFLRKTIRYPRNAKEKNIIGRAFVSFIIERNGSLSDLKLLVAPSEDLGQEALRVMALCPKWVPGKQNNVNVRISYTIPIDFSLPD